MKLKSKLIVTVVLSSLLMSFQMPVLATDIPTNNFTYELSDVLVKHDTIYSEDKEIDELDDFNLSLDNLELIFNQDKMKLTTEINSEKVVFDFNLYPGQLGENSSNTVIGIETVSSSQYDILQCTIEGNATSYGLVKPNLHLEGHTVMTLCLLDNNNGSQYYLQFEVKDLDFNELNSTVNELYDESNMSKEDIFDTQIRYFSMQSKDNLATTFSNIDGQTIESYSDVSSSDEYLTVSEDESVDIEGELLDKIIDSNQPVNINSRALISGIPDSVYKKQENGTWTHHNGTWSSTGTDGYSIYHMNDPYSGNVLNYVMRFYVTTRSNWSAQDFKNSFNISHNVWVQYNKNRNEVYMFDDRAWNGRITLDPEIYINISDSDKNGYFSSRQISSYKNGSWLSNVLSVGIEYVPYLGTIVGHYQTLTSSTATQTGSEIFFEKNYVRKTDISVEGLKYAPNGKGYAQDYIGMTVYGNNVNSVNWGYRYTCRAR